MSPWRPYPLLRLVFSLVTGIILACNGLISGNLVAIIAVIFLSLVTLGIALPRFLRGYRYRWVKGLFIQLAFLAAGNQLAMTSRPAGFDEKQESAETRQLILGKVEDQPVHSKKSTRLILEPSVFDSVKREWRKSASMLVYLERDPVSEQLKTGDIIVLSATPEMISGPGNPGGFDMRKYYRAKGIYMRAYCPAGKWKLLGAGEGFPPEACRVSQGPAA